MLSTEEKGKITACAEGQSPVTSCAATNPFAFSSFRLYEGRNSYTISEAEIRNYFPELMTDYVGACYGMYFAEVADFYCRENNDEKEMMKLVYQSLRALCAPALPNELVRSIFELKAIVVNGEYPGVPEERKLEESTRYALNYIAEVLWKSYIPLPYRTRFLQNFHRSRRNIGSVSWTASFKV